MQQIKPFNIVGTSGLKQAAGILNEEFLTRLVGTRGVAYYREMSDNCAIIGALLYAIESLVRQVEWRVERPDEGDTEQALFVEECLYDMSHTFDNLMSEILSMLVYGWSYFEVVYKKRLGPFKKPEYKSKYTDGKIGWRKISLRAHDTLDHWEFDEDGGIKGMWQHDLWAGKSLVFLPIEKSLLFRPKATKGNPEGRSILRNSVRSHWFLKRIQEIEGIGVERDLAGLPVLEVPPQIMTPNANAAEKALFSDLQTMVQQIRRDEREGVIMPASIDQQGNPTGFKLSLLSSGGRRQMDTNAIITRYETRIVMSVLAEFIMLGMDSTGSFALASDKTRLFSVALGSVMDSIADVFNTFAIPRLMKLNGVEGECPYLVHGDLESPDLASLGTYLTNMAGSGVLGSGSKLERKLLEIAKLPIPEAEEEI